MNYGDKLIKMEGSIVEIEGGAVTMDLLGRLGKFKIPLRMLISQEAPKLGDRVAFHMSFPEILEEDDEK
ncbi:MAG: CBO2463/CBO2479 domain-containing protein [Fusobacteriaceae bacterium]